MAHYNISTGRGGAGNILRSNEKAQPKIVRQGSQTPNILHSVYSTGRGGAGNMRKNVNPKLTRKAQDVEEDDQSDEDQIQLNEEDYINIDGVIDNDNDINVIDGVEPYHVNSTNIISSTVSKIRRLSGESSHGAATSSKSISPKITRSQNTRPQNSRNNKSFRKSLSHEKPKAIAIGRGGAGNILSPSNSRKSVVDDKEKHNHDDHKKKKKKWYTPILDVFG